MKIIFLNTWGGRCKEAISAFLEEQRHTTDIFCFQEFRLDMPALSKSRLTDYTETVFQKDAFSQALYVNKNIPVLLSGPLLQDTSHVGLGAYIKVRYRDTDLYVCNIHGDSVPGDKQDTESRLRQSREILDFFKGKEGLKIIGGDFNLLPETESIALFRDSGYRDLIREFQIATTRNHLAWDKYSSKQYYDDYMFASPELEVQHFSVPALEISDHLPLIVELG